MKEGIERIRIGLTNERVKTRSKREMAERVDGGSEGPPAGFRRHRKARKQNIREVNRYRGRGASSKAILLSTATWTACRNVGTPGKLKLKTRFQKSERGL